MNGWIGVDLDGTLAEYHGWEGEDHIGKPIPKMVERVKAWVSAGRDVRIVTARVPAWLYAPGATEEKYREITSVIRNWCCEHLGFELPVTCVKDYGMVELWDDRAVHVETNTGDTVPVCPKCRHEKVAKQLLVEALKPLDHLIGHPDPSPLEGSFERVYSTIFWFCGNQKCSAGPKLIRSLDLGEETL